MAQKQKGVVAVLHRHYDKIVAVLVLVGLLVSLIYLSQSSRIRKRDYEDFDRALTVLRPTHPESQAVDDSPYQKAQQRLATPFQMHPATNRPFLVAQERVWCVECRQPILFEAENCPFCGKDQPGLEVSDEWDSDGDGLPDVWERRYGLNPLDPKDAHHDLDGDGFTNLEEYLAETDPADPASHPPRVAFLRVHEVVEVPFPLVLLGTIRAPDDTFRYQIKVLSLNQDFYVSEGQPVGASGYVLVKGELRQELRDVPGWNEKRLVDVHFVTVRRGDTTVTLEQGAPGKSSEYGVTFRCDKDRERVDYKAQSGGTFEFDGEEYEVISVDRTYGTVVIRRAADKEEVIVPRS